DAVPGIDGRAAGAVGADRDGVGGRAGVGGIEDQRARDRLKREIVDIERGTVALSRDPDDGLVERRRRDELELRLRPARAAEAAVKVGDVLPGEVEGDADAAVAGAGGEAFGPHRQLVRLVALDFRSDV